MPLENYRDLSQSGSDIGAGFQFEFFCSKCNRKWKSPFKPYRMGQFAGLISRFSFLIRGSQMASRTTGNFADIGSRGAREEALAAAMEQANKLYTVCGSCNGAVCDDCWSARDGSCTRCAENERREAQIASGKSSRESEAGGALACPNCRTPSSGGRFCAECGFDMASTHKSCPGCGTMVLRQSRFCTDCGHSF